MSAKLFATDISEALAQSSLSFLTGALGSIVTDLRAVYETLGEEEGAEAMAEGDLAPTLTFHLRSAIECTVLDHLMPAIRILGQAAIATTADLEHSEHEEREEEPP